MYYAPERKRSRLAELGSNSLNNSIVNSSAGPLEPSVASITQKSIKPATQYLSIPNYSAYRTRNTDPLRDFHLEIEDRYQHRAITDERRRSAVTEGSQQQPHFMPMPQASVLPMSVLPSAPYIPTSQTVRHSRMQNESDLKGEITELKSMMSKLMMKQSDKIDDLILERKIERMMPKKRTQQTFYPPPQPQFIPIPMYPPPQQYPPYPQYPPPQYPQAVPTEPADKSASKRPKFNASRKLRKIFFSVAFPFLLKAFSKKLAGVRYERFQQNLQQSLEACTLSIRNWFLEATNKAMSIIVDKNDVSMDFREEADEMVLEQKLYLLCEVLDSLTNGLLNNTKPEQISDFCEFLELTCCNHSFAADLFFTERQISYLSFSQNHSFLNITKPIQQCQIIVFVYIKMIVYNLLLQPWKFDESFKSSQTTINLFLIASIIYHCSCQLIEKRLNEKQKQTGGWKKGNMVGKYECATFQYKGAQNNPEEFISGMASRKDIAKIEKWNGGKCWKNTMERLEKVMQRIQKQVGIARKEAHKQLLQVEAAM